jgi:hypothetical protein
MKRRLFCILGFIVLAAISIVAIPTKAITSNHQGKYYPLPSWDQTLQVSKRFVIVMNNEAVLDKETGLVWEQSLVTMPFIWEDARNYCNQLTKGNRMGWRLPTIQELSSLVDPSVAPPGPTLPSGHPFSNVQSSGYWSATTYANNAPAWVVNFSNGFVGPSNVISAQSAHVWCVRGGQGVNPQ